MPANMQQMNVLVDDLQDLLDRLFVASKAPSLRASPAQATSDRSPGRLGDRVLAKLLP